jgi:low temperature requirement protein LtrA
MSAAARSFHDPSAHGSAPTAWLILGGTALFLAGHALFKGIFWQVVSWSRVAGAVVLLTLGALARITQRRAWYLWRSWIRAGISAVPPRLG